MADDSTPQAFQGQQGPSTGLGDFNALSFIAEQVLGRAAFAKLVRVQKCTNNGALAPVGMVDVIPMVNQIDGAGNPTPHGIVYSLPYFRIQGGTNAMIMDPQGVIGKPGDNNYYPGDIGLAVICDRDISVVKSTKAAANPGSRRRFDWADGLYIGGFLNGQPVQYIQFQATGITILSPKQVHITTPLDVLVDCKTAEVNATTSLTVTTPTSTFKGDVVIKGNLDVQGP